MSGKLIASTMTQRFCTLERGLENLAAGGFDTIELCTVGDLAPHFDVKNATSKSISETAALVAEKGIKVHCINVGGVYTVEELKKVYELAAATGAKIVTYACGCQTPGVTYEEDIKRRAEFNSRLADVGEEYGVICSIEAPHKLSLAETPEQIDAYWALQDDRVKCTFDVAHLTFSGADMISVAKKYVKRVVHSHLRDAVKGNSLLRYGKGSVDFAAYFKTMKDGGYTGYYSMEYPPENEEETMSRLRESVKYLSQFDI